MPDTTVYFVTNRPPGLAGASPDEAFGDALPQAAGASPPPLAFGVARVVGTDPAPGALVTGRLAALIETGTGDFSAGAKADLLSGAQDLLVFVHGFANSFADALARGAFHREWLASAARPVDSKVIVFTWPSPGTVIDGRSIVPGAFSALLALLGAELTGELKTPLARRYFLDQSNAAGSGGALARALVTLAPLFDAARRQGRRVFLLGHSMGHMAIAQAMASLPVRPGGYFDHAALAAADVDFIQGQLPPIWLHDRLPRHAADISLYFSDADQILRLSEMVNRRMQRLGKDGPFGRDDPALFSPGRYRFVDCTGVQDKVPGDELDKTHQYYRRIVPVRDEIARGFCGLGARGLLRL